jgi:carbon monoxide dehydrogenase subunit G
MTAFTVRDRSTATVAADRGAIWAALTDPDLLAHLTPYLRSIDVDGDRWRWHLIPLPVLGAVVEPSFTEVMTFTEPASITFRHDPAERREVAGVEGSYRLGDHRDGTDLHVDLAVTLDLPFPKIAGPAVRTAMGGVVAHMGRRFGSNLVHHLSAAPG